MPKSMISLENSLPDYGQEFIRKISHRLNLEKLRYPELRDYAIIPLPDKITLKKSPQSARNDFESLSVIPLITIGGEVSVERMFSLNTAFERTVQEDSELIKQLIKSCIKWTTKNRRIT